MKIRCQSCGQEEKIRANQELEDLLKQSVRVLCSRKECQAEYPLGNEDGYVTVCYYLGACWSITRKATVEELQGDWRNKKKLYEARKLLTLNKNR